MMERPKIIRLWGKADNLELEFKNEGGIWKVDIPPDYSDGVYAVILYALNELQEYGAWVGELFMCNGVCHFKIRELPYRMRIKVKEYATEFTKRSNSVISPTASFRMDFTERYHMKIVKKKQSKAAYVAVLSEKLKMTAVANRYVVQIEAKKAKINTETVYRSECKLKTNFQTEKRCHCYYA